MRLLIGSIVFLLCSLAIVFGHFQQNSQAKSASKWPTTEGVVVSAKVVTHQRRNRDEYEPIVNYKYEVLLKEYESEQIYRYMTPYFNQKSKAEQLIAPYYKGKVVEVYYLPEDPNQSVLDPKETSDPWGTLIGAMLFGLVSIILFVLFRLQTKQSSG